MILKLWIVFLCAWSLGIVCATATEAYVPTISRGTMVHALTALSGVIIIAGATTVAALFGYGLFLLASAGL